MPPVETFGDGKDTAAGRRTSTSPRPLADAVLVRIVPLVRNVVMVHAISKR